MGKHDKKRPRDSDLSEEADDKTEQVNHRSKKARVESNKSLFVRSLPQSATNETLAEFFSQHYPVKHAVVVLDPKTKTSRGYGFVTFTDPEDAAEAKQKLDNELLGGRRLKLDIAEPRHRDAAKSATSSVPSKVAEEKRKREEALAEARKAPKLIIRNLPWSIKTEEQLAELFRGFGKVKFADLPKNKGKLKGFGFVTLKKRKHAEKALESINGKEIDGRPLAVDWAVEKSEWEQHLENGIESGADEDEEMDEEKPEKKKAAKSTDKDKGPKTQEDEDLENFMKNFGDNLESEEESGDDDQSDEDQSDNEDDKDATDEDEWEEDIDTPKETEKKHLSTDNSTTIFVRNLPYTTTDEQLKTHFQKFGAIRYARVVMNKATDRSAGTGFVCFFKPEESTACIHGAPRQRPATTLSKRSVLQDETVDSDGRYTLEGRVLQVSQAVSKDEATRLADSAAAGRKGQEKDKRRLYLLSEGTIPKGSPLFNMLAPTEVKIREQSEKQRKKMVQSNPSLHLSLTRLAVRNIPRNMGSKELKALAREAVVGFATDVKAGIRQPLSKEEILRAGEQDKENERHRKEKGKGVVRQAKIVFETKQGSKVAEETGAGKSRGYGFIEYSSHRWALMGLRWLNGHALKNEADKTQRLIVEFAIENANVVQRRRALEEKSRQGSRSQPKTAAAEKEEETKKPEGKGKKVRGKPTKGNDDKVETAHSDEKPKDSATKLAMRTKIIARKRSLRKKKAVTRSKK